MKNYKNIQKITETLNMNLNFLIDSNPSDELFFFLKEQNKEFVTIIGAIMSVGRDIDENYSIIEIKECYEESYDRCLRDEYIAEQISDKSCIYDYISNGIKKLHGIIIIE